MQDNFEMTPIKQSQMMTTTMLQNDENSNNSQQHVLPLPPNTGTNCIGTSSVTGTHSGRLGQNIPTSKNLTDFQTDSIFCPINDPIFYPAASPNIFMDYRNVSNNPYFESAFRANNILASSKKPYNNNLFLTPVKEDDRRKPAYINSILKRLNFDDDFDEMSGNMFMPVHGIFEEKKGVFNVNFNYHMVPPPSMYSSTYHTPFELFNTSINTQDLANIGKNPQIPSGNSSPDSKRKSSNCAELVLPNTITQEGETSGASGEKKNSDSTIQMTSEKKNNVEIEHPTSPYMNGGSNINNGTVGGTSSLANNQNISTNNMFQSSHSVASQPDQKIVKNVNNFNPSSWGTAQNNQKKQKTCNCKKTKCLKLYCDCFAAGELCGVECNCYGCFNNSTSDKRTDAICSIMDRQPDAFGPKVQSNSHKKGCHCTRSGCLKKYCECYTLGVNCGEYCKCTQCKNINFNHIERLASAGEENSAETSKKVTQEGHQQSLDGLESKSSQKKKVFLTSKNENELDEQISKIIHSPIQKEEVVNEAILDEPIIQEEQQVSPSTKMYRTPCKQSTNMGLRSSLPTADTAFKQIENDSEMKNYIVKLRISNTVSQQKLKHNKRSNVLIKSGDSQQSNESVIDQEVDNKQIRNAAKGSTQSHKSRSNKSLNSSRQ